MRTLLQIRLAIEEIFVNIANYAYAPAEGEAEVRCEVLSDPLRVAVSSWTACSIPMRTGRMF